MLSYIGLYLHDLWEQRTGHSTAEDLFHHVTTIVGIIVMHYFSLTHILALPLYLHDLSDIFVFLTKA